MRIMKYIILIITMCTQLSFAQHSYISYSKFVHMPYEQQAKTIIVIQEYLTEYENQQIKGAKNKDSQYHTYLKILNFFVNTAHAAASQRDSQYLCYYGGWQSMMFQGRCMHPKHLGRVETQKRIDKMEISKETKDFLKNDIGRAYYSQSRSSASALQVGSTNDSKAFELKEVQSCAGPDEIICNPQVYGVHQGGKPFCVSGNKSFGINTSYLCAKANQVVKDEEGEQAYKKMMKEIIDGAIAAGNTNHLMSSMRMMYEMCLCSGDSTVVGKDESDDLQTHTLNYAYAQKMFYSRTCLGVLNQTQQIVESIKKNDVACTKIGKTSLMEPSIKKWDWFLNQSYKYVNDELESLKNASSVDLLSGKITRSDLDKIHESDRAQFYQIRNEHFKKYVESGVCPLNSELAMKLGYNAETKILTATISGTLSNNINWSSAIPEAVDGAKLSEVDPNNKGISKKFNVVPTNKEFIAQIKATVDNQDLTQESTIPMIDAKSTLTLNKEANKVIESEWEVSPYFVVSPKFSLGEIDPSKLKLEEAILKTITKTVKDDPTKYLVPMSHEDLTVNGYYEHEGKSIESAPLVLKAPEAKCELTLVATNDPKVKSEITIGFTSDIEEYSPEQLLKKMTDIKVIATVDGKENPLTIKSENSNAYPIENTLLNDDKKLKETVSISATANFMLHGKAKQISCIQGQESKPKEKAKVAATEKKCSISLGQKKKEDGSYIVTSTIVYPGYKAGKSKKLPVTLSWFNKNFKASKAKEPKGKSSKLFRSEDDKKDETKEEDLSESQKKLAKYKKSYLQDVTSSAKKQITVWPKPGEAVKVLVTMNDKNFACYSENEITVNGSAVKAQQPSNNPQFLNSTPIPIRQRQKTFYQGVR